MSLYRHKKTGGLYIVMAGLNEDVFIEATATPAIIYKSLQDDKIWVRPISEFLDGRFEEVSKIKVLEVMPA